MIVDVTGVVLIPGNQGRDCPGNGNQPNIECCCDECDYMLCCFDENNTPQCDICTDMNCPKANGSKGDLYGNRL